MAAEVTFSYEFVEGSDPVEDPNRIKEIQTLNDPEADPPIVDEIISANQFSMEAIVERCGQYQQTITDSIATLMYWNDLKTRLEIMEGE